MKYFIPTELSDDTIAHLNIPNKPIQVNVKRWSLSKADNCFNNVKFYTENNDGSLQFGWKFAILGNVIVRLIGHVVIRTPDLKLKCITPQTDNRTKILFSPDDNVKDLIIDNYLPGKHIPLVENDQVKSYAKLLDYTETLRVKYKVNSPQYKAELEQLNWLATASMPAVLRAAKQHTKMDESCYCGSKTPRNSCCN